MKEPKHRNIIVIHGTMISEVSPAQDGAIMVVNTDEEVRGLKRFQADHDVFVPERFLAEVNKTQRLDTIMIDGYVAPDRLIVCRDFFNISAAFKHQQVSFLRNKNHLTVYGLVSSRVKPIRSGYKFFVTTETEVKTEHEIFANESMAQSVLTTREQDYVLIEGPYSRDKRLIVSNFNNISLAFNSPADRPPVAMHDHERGGHCLCAEGKK